MQYNRNAQFRIRKKNNFYDNSLAFAQLMYATECASWHFACTDTGNYEETEATRALKPPPGIMLPPGKRNGVSVLPPSPIIPVGLC